MQSQLWINTKRGMALNAKEQSLGGFCLNWVVCADFEKHMLEQHNVVVRIHVLESHCPGPATHFAISLSEFLSLSFFNFLISKIGVMFLYWPKDIHDHSNTRKVSDKEKLARVDFFDTFGLCSSILL